MSSRHIHLDHTKIRSSDAQLMATARRDGILACFYFALAALGTNILLPLFARQSQKLPTSITDTPRLITVLGLPLSTVWQLSHILFASCMFLTFFATTVAHATALITITGMSWGVTTWAPYALISAEIAYSKQDRASSLARIHDDDHDHDDDDKPLLHGNHDATAAIMGIHNMAIALPQILAALACALVFKLAELGGRDDGAAWAFRASGCGALVAAWMAGGLKI
jgi:solute carrier family 45 protein 1/2/4